MKNCLFILSLLFFALNLDAQIINIPDPVFKARLVSSGATQNPIVFNEANAIALDANHDGEIQVSEALMVTSLALSSSPISEVYIHSLEGIQYFTNLRDLDCYYNQITSLDLGGMNNLHLIECRYNNITTLNVNGCSQLQELRCSGNQLATLDLVNLPSLAYIYCDSNPLTSLNISGCPLLLQVTCDYTQLAVIDVSSCTNLGYLNATYCPQLTTIFAKNGSNESFSFNFSHSPNVSYICADESQITTVQNLATQYGNTNCVVNSYCSFTPGGNYYTVQGTSTFDSNSNGCDANDSIFSGLKLSYSSTAANGFVTTGASGNYRLDLPQGSYTFTPALENSSYFIVSPTTLSATFPGQSSPLTQNFCVSPNGTHNDLEVTLLPMSVARPGFDASYKIVYKNVGTHAQTGNVTLAFDDSKMDYVSSIPVYTNQSTDLLSWNYANLLLFETREIKVSFNINSPIETQAVNIGDFLNFTATANPVSGDQVASNNVNGLRQTVVGSLDPNDKTCVEGTVVSTTQIGNYVHYIIRFENTGTHAAQNVVVKDLIDTNKFTTSTIVPIGSSHPMTTRFTSPNKLEFIFENIQLPFDDANNDGYVAFKIKIKPGLVSGNTFSNAASIYFDYNHPIVTNTETTTIQTLANVDFEFSNYFTLYPNPVKNLLYIQSKSDIEVTSISVYNTLGQLILVVSNANETKSIDVCGLKIGTYFIKINSDKGTSNTKFIKE